MRVLQSATISALAMSRALGNVYDYDSNHVGSILNGYVTKDISNDNRMIVEAELLGEVLSLELEPRSVLAPDFELHIISEGMTKIRKHRENIVQYTYSISSAQNQNLNGMATLSADGSIVDVLLNTKRRLLSGRRSGDGTIIFYDTSSQIELQGNLNRQVGEDRKRARAERRNIKFAPVTKSANRVKEQLIEKPAGQVGDFGHHLNVLHRTLRQEEPLKQIDLVLDFDYDLFFALGSDEEVCQQKALSLVAAVNVIYESQLGLTHSLKSVNVRSVPNYSASERQSLLFEVEDQWQPLEPSREYGALVLVTGKVFADGVLNAEANSVCQDLWKYGLASMMDSPTVASAIDTQALRLAHTLGHMWGAASHVAESGFVMSTTEIADQASFKDTSIADINAYIAEYGPLCLTEVQPEVGPCSVSPCLNDGTCLDDPGAALGYRCECGGGFAGANCDEVGNSCSSKPCKNGGVCTPTESEFSCTCAFTGFTGPTCEVDVDECASQNPCKNGECVNEEGTFSCTCDAGFSGRLCDSVACVSGRCKNGGTCTPSTVAPYYACECASGFSGTVCSTNVNDCRNPALNLCDAEHSTCKDEVNGVSCICDAGYLPPYCIEYSCPCVNDGVCVKSGENTVCKCPAGHWGPNCQNTPSASNKCLVDGVKDACNGNGNCKETDNEQGFLCECVENWEGTTCNKSTVDYCALRPCQFAGTCLSLDTGHRCYCLPGRGGDNCELDMKECDSNPCQNGGACVEKHNRELGVNLMGKRVCIMGAGAIGGLLGVKLAVSGNQVTFVARGAHLKAMSENGFTLAMADGTIHNTKDLDCQYTDDLSTIHQEQDVIIICLKGHQIQNMLTDMNNSRILGESTMFVTTQNGIPWWLFQCCPEGSEICKYENTVVRAVDPDGSLFNGIDPKRIIGCVSYPAARVSKHGTVEHLESIRFPVGELNGSIDSARIKMLSNLLIAAGFKSPILPDIRSEIWLKLYGSVAFNPISALTHSTLKEMCEYASTRQLIELVMGEIEEVGGRLGLTLRVSKDRRIGGAIAVGEHKTSMLMDVENGKPMEIDGLVGSVVELAELTGSDIPHTRTIFCLVNMLGYIIAKHSVAFPEQQLGTE
ncbi:hypothetical protein SARC_11877 [Sphaeroforma arctica JP610]|uniref:2-dehydropantoate 2-reductase n=1 Tax=Sphaeroforma arctica JP610 TaxID=667725 RepID=A0A0L0FFQ5_9EUKA|nr:hypothetical protein SARC_11877 [Sphaeroforma arctica JP610]KNC75602.1 hypothetical protein SARC_11877 [Sphaeroforma arctica JP610]|eukprot:XP_014149504.1 hypothetical protein SARC_11877 [Sphaeroforma arctica JP610]